MKSQHTWILAAIAGLSIAGAGQAAEPPGFATYVAQGYREIAFFALNQIASPAIAAHFASRAQLADVAGMIVEPEAIGDWDVDRKLATEARSARRQLMDRLGNGAGWYSPLTSAVAVLNFDCWVGFASADPLSSAECRRRFLAALQGLPAHPSSAPAPAGTTTILIALPACAAPPWLGDCPLPGAPGRPSRAPPPQRHAAGEAGSRPAVSAVGTGDATGTADDLPPISALATVGPSPADASLAETIGSGSANAPAE